MARAAAATRNPDIAVTAQSAASQPKQIPHAYERVLEPNGFESAKVEFGNKAIQLTHFQENQNADIQNANKTKSAQSSYDTPFILDMDC